jgi:hypothetical protein
VIAAVDFHDELPSWSHEVDGAGADYDLAAEPDPELAAGERSPEEGLRAVGSCRMLRARPARRATWLDELWLCAFMTSPCGEWPTKPSGADPVPRAAHQFRVGSNRAGSAQRVRLSRVRHSPRGEAEHTKANESSPSAREGARSVHCLSSGGRIRPLPRARSRGFASFWLEMAPTRGRVSDRNDRKREPSSMS